MIELLMLFLLGVNLIFVFMIIFFVCTIKYYGNAIITTYVLFILSFASFILTLSIHHDNLEYNMLSLMILFTLLFTIIDWDSDIHLWDMIFILPKALFYKEYRMLLDMSHAAKYDHRGYRYNTDNYKSTIKITPKVIGKYLNKDYCNEQELLVLKGIINNATNITEYNEICNNIKLYINEQQIIINKMQAVA